MPESYAAKIDAHHFVNVEGAFDEAMGALAGSDAIPAIALDFEPELEFHKPKEALGTASQQPEVAGMRKGKWTSSHHMRANAAGTAPPHAQLLQIAFAQAGTVVPATSVTYSLLAGVTLSGQLVRHIPGVIWEGVTGAWIEEVTFKAQGNEEPEIAFSGGFARYGWVYGAPVSTATISSGATSFSLAAAHVGKIGAGSRIQIGTDNNASAGYLVTDVTAAGVVTFSPSLGTTQTGATTILGYTPTPTYAGAILQGVNMGWSLGGASLGLISGTVSFKTGVVGLDKEGSSDRVTRLARGPREITCDWVGYYLHDVNAAYLGRAWNGTGVAGVLRAGQDVAAARAVMTMPNFRLPVTPIKIPDAEVATFTAKGVARRSAANEDEFTLAYT